MLVRPTEPSPEPRKRKRTAEETAGINNELLDALLGGYQKPADLLGADGLFKRLTKALIERAMEAEMTQHLGYGAGDEVPAEQDNRRNGSTKKKLRTEQGTIEISQPRDRSGTFEPQLIPKHKREFNGFDDKIMSMYARGMTTREIQGHLEEIYGVNVSPELVSRATDAIVEELRAWQHRALDGVYLVAYLDALVLKVREQGVVRNKSAYLVVGVKLTGEKEVLGLWLESTEGAKFWLKVMTELKNRGVEDILIACCDGLKGLPEAIEAVFPQTTVQLCIVHMIRNSTRFVNYKERKAVAADLRRIYTAETEALAGEALTDFAEKWDRKYPMISKSWLDSWEYVTPFLAYPKDIRKAIYTTNAIESLNRQLRKIIKTRGHFPTDQAAEKLLYLTLMRAEKKWGRPFPQFSASYNQFAIYFAGRLPNT